MEEYNNTNTTTIEEVCDKLESEYILNNVNHCQSPTFILGSNDPAFQYQTQKIIQNTVRVYSSLYTDNLGALNIYQSPKIREQVNWNQMSDRANPHYQTNSSFSQGSFYHGNSRRHTQTRCQPGATNPGGVGVDIKHNSYYRYLGRLKARKPFKREVVSSTFGKPIPYNPVLPVYGAKTMKMNIVSRCNSCPADSKYDPLVYKIYNSAEKLDTQETV
jgi:hypothetical protein